MEARWKYGAKKEKVSASIPYCLSCSRKLFMKLLFFNG